MDINTIIKLVQSVPPDKLTDEKTLRKVLKAAGKESGQKFSDEELNRLVKNFKKIASGGMGSALGMISMLMKSGVSQKQINNIKKKMN
ncbi:stage VI sporulation protein F [Ammoniphilus sp. CFH 90114]|uniref:stage VI sporulation protein F n=1 Tax=Ammoniphilus sp. CFH 90114 TaxID=2493665 RepID=UPI00100F8355|nr:stage VI sporulation protein F [Ammoniphilus sp. CFH 90114]RXT08052.1 hypothetical protein EIZ39_11620 [Ammoniphilus sp. CFH 90114]